MTDLQKLYLEQIEEYCNFEFDPDNLPGGIALALEEMVKVDPSNYSMASKRLDDMTITYYNTGSAIPNYILGWINPYRRAHLIDNKVKKKWR